MTYDDIKILSEKAKIKANGVYSYKGILYAVSDNKFVAYSDRLGNCYQNFGSFVVKIGNVMIYDRRKELNKWLKNNK